MLFDPKGHPGYHLLTYSSIVFERRKMPQSLGSITLSHDHRGEGKKRRGLPSALRIHPLLLLSRQGHDRGIRLLQVDRLPQRRLDLSRREESDERLKRIMSRMQLLSYWRTPSAACQSLRLGATDGFQVLKQKSEVRHVSTWISRGLRGSRTYLSVMD